MIKTPFKETNPCGLARRPQPTRHPPPTAPRTQVGKERPLCAFNKLCTGLPQADLPRFRKIYERTVHKLSAMLTTDEAYVRPEQSRKKQPFVQEKMPDIRRDKFEPGVIHSKTAFAQRAIERPSPLATADREVAAELPTDLRLAIDFVASRGAKIVKDRERRLEQLRACAADLSDMRAALDACKTKEATLIAAPFNVAWTAAVIDAMMWPDIDLPLRYVKGFDVVFDVPDSGVFRQEFDPAEISKKTFMEGNTKMVAQISNEIKRSATEGDAQAREGRKQCWIRTKEEIKEGLVFGPYSRARMDKKYKRGRWRCLGRSAILQKGKFRCIDNGKRNKANKATTMHERITCGRADFPVMVAREFAKRRAAAGVRKKPPMKMQHGTSDLRAAYRRVPTRQPQFTCVAVWDDDAKKVAYCDVPGHNFGLKSAVVNFNRFPELAAVAARRLLWCVTEHYYDDNDSCEPRYAGTSGQDMLIELCGDDFFGFSFDPGKTESMEESNEYLGVVSDLSRVHEGVLMMDVSSKRRKKIKALTTEILQERKLRSGMAASIFGKSRFMLSPCFGSLGKACLQPIMAREYQRNASDLTEELADSVEFIDFLCDHLPPLELPLLPSELEKVVIFSDAEGKQRDGEEAPSGHLGAVVYHPVHGRHYCYAKAPDHWVALFDRIKQRSTYIGQFELCAALAAIISLPEEWLRGRPIELWVDNSGAVGSLVKGYSGIADCARIVNLFHFAIARIGVASIWIDYVASESNPADVPSRLHEMSAAEAKVALSEFGSIMGMTLPVFATEDGDWLSSVEIAKTAWNL